ncbi:cysteine desulfurase NifS [Mangrovactinospora gilvigrisea]|uniref:cysteine desulfurase n=1 Tax=Mangrovactinospora gilvigrisea TaxID=1428644 RepID=A0A1J7CAT0_9ACTN|nr:cysteine desulfurase family protein [Mangrovactinospora gilvigrisea]OIV36762.1 cysteine desulfurase NifS [Mangrovactinospora gilvigrisea]
MPYLDHAATTPIHPDALAALTAHLATDATGNPSSLHASGRRARRVVEESRESLAASLGARPSEIVLTGGGTESDNLALKGLYWSLRAQAGPDGPAPRLLVNPTEHHAVLDTAVWLAEHEGARLDWLPVDRLGRVSPEELDAALAAAPDVPTLVSVMWANNEVGTVNPVRELVAAAHRHGALVHSDAVQALGQLPVSFAESGLDAMTVTAHKIGGPVGTGALLLTRELAPVPLLHGGGQERDVRSGTLDTAGAAAFAAAAAAAVRELPEHAARLTALRDELIAAVAKEVPEAVLTGDPGPGPEGRLPGNAHFAFPGCEGDSLLLLLDAQGIECSTGSACTAGIAQPSHVLLAMGYEPEEARGTLRFSLGRTSTSEDVAAVAAAIGPAVERARTAGLSR